MVTVKNVTKIFKNESYRILAIAIFASLLWHLFWISTIKIVSSADSALNVRFSRVSFLGPLLGGAMDLQARPKERSFLEKRYIAMAKRSAQEERFRTKIDVNGYDAGNDAYHLKDDGMTGSVDEVLSGEKIEPPALEE